MSDHLHAHDRGHSPINRYSTATSQESKQDETGSRKRESQSNRQRGMVLTCCREGRGA
uniref:Uncharacterized protein n=1 Tax=Arundo donax TaxID=35708 RepID=A0A0A9EHK5_ARUDO